MGSLAVRCTRADVWSRPWPAPPSCKRAAQLLVFWQPGLGYGERSVSTRGSWAPLDLGWSDRLVSEGPVDKPECAPPQSQGSGACAWGKLRQPALKRRFRETEGEWPPRCPWDSEEQRAEPGQGAGGRAAGRKPSYSLPQCWVRRGHRQPGSMGPTAPGCRLPELPQTPWCCGC